MANAFGGLVGLTARLKSEERIGALSEELTSGAEAQFVSTGITARVELVPFPVRPFESAANLILQQARLFRHWLGQYDV
jgi:hypothetical protein